MVPAPVFTKAPLPAMTPPNEVELPRPPVVSVPAPSVTVPAPARLPMV